MNKINISFTALAGVLFSAMSATASVTWSVESETGVGSATGSGNHVFEEAQSLTGMNVSARDAITLSGEGISFTTSASSVSICGTTVFDLTLASEGNLSFVHSGGYDKRMYNETANYNDSDYYLTTSFKTVFEDMALSDYLPVSGLTAGAAISGDGKTLKPFHVRRGEDGDGEYLVCQFQVIDNQVKCLKVKFVQVGTAVKAKVIYSRWRGDKSSFGSDFDEGDSSGSGVATGLDVHGYGIYSVIFARGLETAHLTLNKKVDATSLAIGENIVAVADLGDVLAGSGTTLPAMQIDGSLTITNVLNLVVANGLSGTGELYLGGHSGTFVPEIAEFRYDNTLPSNWTPVMYGGLLSSITNVYINAFAGSAINNPDQPTWIYHLRSIGNILEGQCQIVDGSWLKCVYLEFKQVSTNIYAHVKSKCYCSRYSNDIGVDFDTLEFGEPASDNHFKKKISDYEVASITLHMDVDTPQNLSTVMYTAFSGENTMSGGGINQRGGNVEIFTKNALSANGGIYTVSNGGMLVLNASSTSLGNSIGNGKTELHATGGATILQNANCQLDYQYQNIYLDAAVLDLASTNTNGRSYPAYDSVEYVNFITLANGSRVIGFYPRIGYSSVAPVWKVTGTSPSFLDTGLFTYSTTGQLCTFDIEDVTGDREADFIVNGPILPNRTTAVEMILRKAGLGTMRLNMRAQSFTPLCLDAGVLELGDSDILCGKPSVVSGITTPVVPIQFGGGALASVAGTSNAVGCVSLTNDSQIVVGENAVFTFADSSAETWADGKMLSITGEFKRGSVRFGTSDAALTEVQKSALRINGEKAILDSQGYVRYNKLGLRILFH